MTARPSTPHCVSSHVASTCKSQNNKHLCLDSVEQEGSPLSGPCSCSPQCAKQAQKLAPCLGPTGSSPLCHPPQLQQTADVQSHQGSLHTGEIKHDPEYFLTTSGIAANLRPHGGTEELRFRYQEHQRAAGSNYCKKLFAHLGY